MLSGKQMSVAEVMQEIEKDGPFYQMSGGGVTISGGEPLRQPRFLAEILRACKAQQFHTVLETSGYGAWSTFQRILADVDLFMYDIKLIDPDEHRKLTGVSNKSILDNLHKLSASGKTVLVRTPLIPGYTTSNGNLVGIAKLLQSVGIPEIELLPYNRLAGNKYGKLGRRYGLQTIEYPEEIMKEAKEVFRSCNIRTR
jgi:pyruvate formate lyase activating enzyme